LVATEPLADVKLVGCRDLVVGVPNVGHRVLDHSETIIDPGISEFWDRTIGNQAGRDSPFSIWGQEPSLDWLHTAVKVFAAALALLVAFVPKRRDLVTVSALGAAVLIAVQLTIEHWFYLYIPWFLPFLLVALLAPRATEPKPEPSPG
jgi:hypothetical protein